MGMRTVPRLDSFPTDTSPRTIPLDWHFPDRNFSDRHFPEWTVPRPDTSPKDTFPTGHFLTKTFPRTDISPLRHFPERTFHWPDISLTTCFWGIFFFQIIFCLLVLEFTKLWYKLWLGSATINNFEKDMD